MAKIGPKTIQLCTDKVQSLLNEYNAELNKAYLHAGGALKVGLTLTINPDLQGNKVTAGIKFVVDEAKGTSDPGWADEDQLSLLDPKENAGRTDDYCMRARPGAWSRGHGRWC